VEGVGHFEPLRHYAECHLLLEPLKPGSGLVFDTVCPTDVLDLQYQKLILTHLSEKTHVGVLTGSPITDMKITLLIGRAHLKHTEGGDFRQLQIALRGYAPCHNPEAVMEEIGYDPESDLENTPDSVFCDHGAGFTVKWNRVKDYMHLESGLKEEKPEIITRNLAISDKELEAIMEREFGPVKRPLYHAPANRPAQEQLTIRPLKEQCLIVDGYNIIFAWEDLAQTAASDLDAARRGLLDRLSSYAGFKKCRLIVVFDGYKQKGNPGEKEHFHNIQVVYTKEGETGDAYIESLVSQIGRNYAVRVATSDGLVQISSLRSGVLRMSARELQNEVESAQKEMRKHFRK
jgi:predicted RNA-binding protein with PIN domain